MAAYVLCTLLKKYFLNSFLQKFIKNSFIKNFGCGRQILEFSDEFSLGRSKPLETTRLFWKVQKRILDNGTLLIIVYILIQKYIIPPITSWVYLILATSYSTSGKLNETDLHLWVESRTCSSPRCQGRSYSISSCLSGVVAYGHWSLLRHRSLWAQYRGQVRRHSGVVFDLQCG